jgi:hypothetical protein
MDDPYVDTYLFPSISGVMVSIIAFGKLCSGAKTLGWEHSNGTLKDDFENLGIVLYSTEIVFRKNICSGKWRNGGGGFMKKGTVYKCSPDQLLPCNHITPVWDGA